jgi:hypothetical protein
MCATIDASDETSRGEIVNVAQRAGERFLDEELR